MTITDMTDWDSQAGMTNEWGTSAWISPFAIGLDLGQSTDYSALAIIEHVNVLPPGYTEAMFHTGRHGRPMARRELHVRHLQRWPLGTAYHEIVAECVALTNRPALAGARFYFDRGGVGRAVGDLLYAEWLADRVGSSQPVGITTTSGDASHGASVTKRDLMAALQLPLQQGRMKIPAALPLGNVLERELSSFTMKISASGRDTYDVKRREGEGHGDLVIAAALASRRPDWGISPTPIFQQPTIAHQLKEII